MIATPPSAERQFVTISPNVFPPEDGTKSRLEVPCLCTCGVLPQPVADGRMATPIEASSAYSNTNAQPCGNIPDRSTTTGIGQDSRPALPPQHPLLQSFPKVNFDLFNSL